MRGLNRTAVLLLFPFTGPTYTGSIFVSGLLRRCLFCIQIWGGDEKASWVVGVRLKEDPPIFPKPAWGEIYSIDGELRLLTRM